MRTPASGFLRARIFRGSRSVPASPFSAIEISLRPKIGQRNVGDFVILFCFGPGGCRAHKIIFAAFFNSAGLVGLLPGDVGIVDFCRSVRSLVVLE